MRITEMDRIAYAKNVSDPESAYNKSLNEVLDNQARWTEFEGIEVLRVKSSNYIAVPCTERRNSAIFLVIDIEDRSDIVCQLTKKEVCGWLCKRAII